MRIKIENRINLIPITLYLIWCLYVLYFFLFKMKSFANESPCGAGYLMIGFPIITVLLVSLILLLMTILNLLSKKSIYSDYSLIALIWFFMMICFFINILLIRLF